MLPLVLSLTFTVLKIQDRTVENPAVFRDVLTYTDLSCVRFVDDLLMEELDSSKLTGKRRCDDDALSEMNRLRN